MANYHCTINPPSASISAKNHAAYIERDGKYETRKDFERSESGNMPKWAEHDSSLFWEAADRFERANGRTYREIEVSLPRELSEAQRVELVRDFVGQVLGDKHPYTWAIHNPPARDGGEQPHAHIMFSERINDGRDPELFFKRVNHQYPEKGGAGKNRYFNSKEFVLHTRELWARVQNQHLEKAGLTLRVDHRSYKEQGAGLEPTRKLGRADYLEKQGQATEIGSANREIMRRNGDRIIAAPGIAIENLTRHQSTFTKRDLERYLMRNTDGADQFQVASLRVLGSPSIIALQDGKEMRYSSRELYEAEGRVLRRSEALGRSESAAPPASAIAQASHGRSFNADQAAAFAVLTGRQQLAAVNGSAGTGKSYMLSAVREAYERDGFKVYGAALQGVTADNLRRDAGISSSTLHSLLGRLDQGQIQLDRKSVIVVDEAGMVGSRQYDRLLEHVEKSGANLRLVGDVMQLHAVDAGNAFRHMLGRAPVAEMREVQRQRQDWQRSATERLAKHDVGSALDAYGARGKVAEFSTQDDAKRALLEKMVSDKREFQGGSQIILAYTNHDRRDLNLMVRELRQAGGEIGRDHYFSTAGGEIALGAGDRLMFLKNEYGDLDVRNGTLGTVSQVQDGRLSVRLDSGREVAFSPSTYKDFDYGYATTIHKSQGVTVDRAYLLASKQMRAESTYVGMSRHREDLQVVYSQEHFADREALSSQLAKPEFKDFSAIYQERYTEVDMGAARQDRYSWMLPEDAEKFRRADEQHKERMETERFHREGRLSPKEEAFLREVSQQQIARAQEEREQDRAHAQGRMTPKEEALWRESNENAKYHEALAKEVWQQNLRHMQEEKAEKARELRGQEHPDRARAAKAMENGAEVTNPYLRGRLGLGEGSGKDRYSWMRPEDAEKFRRWDEQHKERMEMERYHREGRLSPKEEEFLRRSDQEWAAREQRLQEQERAHAQGKLTPQEEAFFRASDERQKYKEELGKEVWQQYLRHLHEEQAERGHELQSREAKGHEQPGREQAGQQLPTSDVSKGEQIDHPYLRGRKGMEYEGKGLANDKKEKDMQTENASQLGRDEARRRHEHQVQAEPAQRRQEEARHLTQQPDRLTLKERLEQRREQEREERKQIERDLNKGQGYEQ